MRYDAYAFGGNEKKFSDDALRWLINESLAKFVGHFVIERRVARDRALDIFDGDRTPTEPSHLESAFISAVRELEAFVVAAVADAGQAAVARAAVAAVERACASRSRGWVPGSKPRHFGCATPPRAPRARARVLELLEDDTADACATSATRARAAGAAERRGGGVRRVGGRRRALGVRGGPRVRGGGVRGGDGRVPGWDRSCWGRARRRRPRTARRGGDGAERDARVRRARGADVRASSFFRDGGLSVWEPQRPKASVFGKRR